MKVEYINKPLMPVTVLVIGAGGNGSQMLTQLGRIDYALKALGKPGLDVTMMDDDKVSPANIGRQLFAESETGQYKSNVLITRINRFYGLEWNSIPTRFKYGGTGYNVVITCTDNVDSRIAVSKWVVQPSQTSEHERRFHYWLDIGNLKNTGQVILGSPVYNIPTVIDRYPRAKKMEAKDNTPSCSLAEALSKQDLFVNTFITNIAAKLFWEMLTAEESINWRGAYMNLESFNIKK